MFPAVAYFGDVALLATVVTSLNLQPVGVWFPPQRKYEDEWFFGCQDFF